MAIETKKKAGLDINKPLKALVRKLIEQYSKCILEMNIFMRRVSYITTQLRFHMVSPQLVLLIILTMQSYKFYLALQCCAKLVLFGYLSQIESAQQWMGRRGNFLVRILSWMCYSVKVY